MRLIDLCCGAGGAAMGYHRAGFDEIVGVDIKPQPRYPFTFVQADALEYFDAHGHEFDAAHASPPCQAKTTMSNRWRGKGGKADGHVNRIPMFHAKLTASGLPYVLENVPGARDSMPRAFTLTGGMFGLQVHRPRLFVSNVLIMLLTPAQPPQDALGIYGKAHDGRLLFRRIDGSEQRAAASLDEARRAMGIDWMQWRELAEAIPPAYTEYIGRQLLHAIQEGQPVMAAGESAERT